jgi:hypothetical protein
VEKAVLLAGFAFEAYKDPVGGTRDQDASGASTTYLSSFVREAYAGVLELHLLDAADLPAGDITGQSDPYVLASVGASVHRTSTRRFTRSPVWKERCRLFVRDAQTDTLRLRVMDEDWLKEDDTLGVAATDLGPLCDGQTHSVTLPVLGGGAGPGGGTLRVSLRYLAFAAPPPPSAAQPRSKAPWWQAVLHTARSSEDKSLGGLAGAVVAAVSGALDNQKLDAERKAAEAALWAIPPDGDWALLASSPASRVALPSDFEKLAFVAHEHTDTQCAVWRCAHERTVIVAFRGTEQSSMKDLLIDCRLAPRSWDAERSGDSQSGAAVHDGFFEAWCSVRPRIFAAVDDAMGCGARARALGRSADGETWDVCVTGHSLGGALATLCAAELAGSVRTGRRPNVRVSMTNFGSPRVGNSQFVEQYNQLVPDSIRIVNSSDAIPTVPALLGYRHVAHGVRVSVGGETALEVPPAMPAEGSAEGVASLAVAALTTAASAGALDISEAAEAAAAIAALVDAAALENHFEHKYLDGLRLALKASASTRGER